MPSFLKKSQCENALGKIGANVVFVLLTLAVLKIRAMGARYEGANVRVRTCSECCSHTRDSFALSSC